MGEGTQRQFSTFNDWMTYVWNNVLESKYEQDSIDDLNRLV